jgi:hypothetical protein
MTAKLANPFLVASAVTALIALSLAPLKTVNTLSATVQDSVNMGVNSIQNSTANSIFETHKMALGDNVKNLVILIPNEGHHGPQADEDRFIDQPFIPQNAVLNTGTNII